jgi:hypothetical protein
MRRHTTNKLEPLKDTTMRRRIPSRRETQGSTTSRTKQQEGLQSPDPNTTPKQTLPVPAKVGWIPQK